MPSGIKGSGPYSRFNRDGSKKPVKASKKSSVGRSLASLNARKRLASSAADMIAVTDGQDLKSCLSRANLMLKSLGYEIVVDLKRLED